MARAMATRVAMKPLSPSPWQVGESRTTQERTPRDGSASTACAVTARIEIGEPSTAGLSRSVDTCPGASPARPEARTKGRSVPASASPKVSTARRSASAAPRKSPEKAMSCLKARWITPSDAAAVFPRTSRSSTVPLTTSAPAAESAAADVSERASPTTWCPASTSSDTTAEPIQPDAPVTKMRMGGPQLLMSVTVIDGTPDVSSCHHVGSAHGQMGAGRARTPGERGAGAVQRARLRADDCGGDRQAGRAHGADLLPALRRQA